MSAKDPKFQRNVAWKVGQQKLEPTDDNVEALTTIYEVFEEAFGASALPDPELSLNEKTLVECAAKKSGLDEQVVRQSIEVFLAMGVLIRDGDKITVADE